LAILSPEGKALSVNQMWKNLTKLQQGSEITNWTDVLVPGEATQNVFEAWHRLIREKKPVTIQSQIKGKRDDLDLDVGNNQELDTIHILVALYPDLDEDGEIMTLMSCITDITDLKRGEIELTKKMEQAIEMKKQQERFIDMTSHEMRNPLSALIGCADEIIFALRECCKIRETRGSHPIGNGSNGFQHEANLLNESLENADTIIYCALHQKRSKCLSASEPPHTFMSYFISVF
jgi:signal transduction histidine kinase